MNRVGPIGFKNEVSLSRKIIMRSIAVDQETPEDRGCIKGCMMESKGLALDRHEVSGGRDKMRAKRRSGAFYYGRMRVAGEPECRLGHSKSFLVDHKLKDSRL